MFLYVSGNRFPVLPGDRKLDVTEVEEVDINPGDGGAVDEEGAVDADELGAEVGFPLGNRRVILEAPAVSCHNDGGVIVGFDIENFLSGQIDRLPVRGKRDGTERAGTLLVQPSFEEIAACGERGQDDGDEDRIGQEVGDVRHEIGRDVTPFPEEMDIIVGDQEQEHLPDQDPQYDEDGIFDARPALFEIYLGKEEFGRQGAGQEQGPDEQSLEEAVSQADEDHRHQQDGDDPVGYDQQPFHYLHKNSK